MRGSLPHVVDTLRPAVVRGSLPHVVDTPSISSDKGNRGI